MFSNTDVLVATAMLQWANEHLCTPNDRMRRSRGGPTKISNKLLEEYSRAKARFVK
jgi:hypothetical protein